MPAQHLYMCEYTLNFYKTKSEIERHYKRNTVSFFSAMGRVQIWMRYKNGSLRADLYQLRYRVMGWRVMPFGAVPTLIPSSKSKPRGGQRFFVLSNVGCQP